MSEWRAGSAAVTMMYDQEVSTLRSRGCSRARRALPAMQRPRRRRVPHQRRTGARVPARPSRPRGRGAAGGLGLVGGIDRQRHGRPRLHGLLADDEPAGDLRLGEPVRDQEKDLALARGSASTVTEDPGDASRGGRAPRPAVISRRGRAGHRRLRSPSRRRTAVPQEVIQQEAAGSCLECVVQLRRSDDVVRKTVPGTRPGSRRGLRPRARLHGGVGRSDCDS